MHNIQYIIIATEYTQIKYKTKKTKISGLSGTEIRFFFKKPQYC